MIFASSDSRKNVRDIGNEFGLDFEDYGYVMQGGKRPANSKASLSKVAWSSSLFTPLERVFSKIETPVMYEDGIGALLDTSGNNKHVFPILRADPGSYSFKKEADQRQKIGPVSGS